ncbi:hypothetical protein VB602_14070 [Vibrio parahaemolyticus]|uniref:hypothetical protein n=3 Tax=Vibrio parahaemolyticus TaxID=670 RepID=UPI0011247C4B|nr:hypothetical protein [Vibrio parahaemolyticus]MBE4029228.1 hypothetical protein [Vibrio parahaemolyticus]MBE4105016.1 hypothetical protein [Vibrio parahaemolyticus]MEA5237436.1 hypothetical protein [Vibrio parahaemolyticus]TOO58715.1 hypothetical protein CGH33_15590 [Vibrio parahaemolyticus]HCG5520132.1 hypothetical protein [Vibrio parahaemolyticus]
MPTSYAHQLDTLLARFNFHFTKSQINQVIQTTARSKDSFKESVLNIIASNRALKNKVNELGLLALQLDTRQVEVFKVSNASAHKALNNLFINIKLTNSTLIRDAFPFPIEDKANLSQLKTSTVYPILSDTVNLGDDDYNRLVVSTVAEKEIEEPVPAAHLSQAGLALQNADTTYTMKRRVRTQLFHVIYWSSTLHKLILSVDRNVMSLSASQDQLFILRRFLMLNKVDYGNATNVFGAIEPLYNANDGYITKLGHVTTNGNPVRIPLKSKQKCLKQDNYHQAGEGGGHVHAKFAVFKKWEFAQAGSKRVVDIEVGLAGQPKMLDTAQPLTDFSINKPKRLEDFNFAIDKVLSHI